MLEALSGWATPSTDHCRSRPAFVESSAIAGPVAAIFLLNQGLPRATFLGTTVIYFFGINTTKLIPYTVIPGLTDWAAVAVGLCFLPFAPLGTWLGKRFAARLSERVFRNVILGLTFVTGVQLVAEYVTGVKLVQVFSGRGGR